MEFQYPLQIGVSDSYNSLRSPCPSQCIAGSYSLNLICNHLMLKGLFLIFVELYLKCVFFWLLMFSFLHSGSQAGAQELIPGPQIYSHRFDGLNLVLPVLQSTWMGRSQAFTGTVISAVETILLAAEAQFRWGGAHISCLKCVKPHHSSVIRPTGIFSFLSSWSTFSHSSKSYFTSASSQSP